VPFCCYMYWFTGLCPKLEQSGPMPALTEPQACPALANLSHRVAPPVEKPGFGPFEAPSSAPSIALDRQTRFLVACIWSWAPQEQTAPDLRLRRRRTHRAHTTALA
jgi:hypothetical protein